MSSVPPERDTRSAPEERTTSDGEAAAAGGSADGNGLRSDRPRWDSDSRLIGVADASHLTGEVRRLLDACTRPGWITEDADTYIGLQLRDACDAAGSVWRWVNAAQGADGTYVVDLVHHPASANDPWEDAVALLASVAEHAFYLRRVDPRTVECVTGMLDGDGRFAAHGHAIRLRIA